MTLLHWLVNIQYIYLLNSAFVLVLKEFSNWTEANKVGISYPHLPPQPLAAVHHVLALQNLVSWIML